MESLAIFSDSSLERVLLIPVSILIYMSSSSWVIVANQQLIKEVGFPFPVLLSAFGAFSSATVAHLSVYADVVSIRKETLEYATGKNWRQNVLPVALCQAATLALGNASYLYFGLGMVQMLKAGTPIFVLLTLVMLRLERPSLITAFFVSLITLGTLVTAGTTPQWDATGLCFSVGAMVTEALRVGLTQFLLKSCKFSVTEGQYILAPTVSIALLLASACIEGKDLNFQAVEKVFEYPHLFVMAAGLGTAVNYSSYWVIKTCGALTLKVVTTLRNIALVLYGAFGLGEALSESQVWGYALTLLGFVGYTYFSSPGKEAQVKPETSGKKSLRGWRPACWRGKISRPICVKIRIKHSSFMDVVVIYLAGMVTP